MISAMSQPITSVSSRQVQDRAARGLWIKAEANKSAPTALHQKCILPRGPPDVNRCRCHGLRQMRILGQFQWECHRYSYQDHKLDNRAGGVSW